MLFLKINFHVNAALWLETPKTCINLNPYNFRIKNLG